MKKLALSLLSAFVLCTPLIAQLNMTRTTYTAAYVPISLPAATLSTATGDDVAQSAIPIGFTFNYLGTNYTTIGVNTNGVASFETVMSGSGTNNNLFAGNAPDLSLAPWWDNLYSDTVLYQLQGIPGNQTFTIQWTNTFSYFNTATQMLNFQVILHETTNEIEFAYGQLVPGVTAANESASIGIEGATGGAGDYLDAVTGSAFTSNGMINAATQWPSHNFRFTPGTPTPVAGGTYTVGVSGNYFSLSEAIADVNHRGVSGPVVLSLIDATYDVTPANGDNFFPMLLGPVAGTAVNSVTIASASGTATISSEGALNGNCGNAAANNVISNANEPVLAVVGGNFITLQNINLTCSATGVVDRGLQVVNSSSTVGSQNNTFQNISVSLNRSNTGCYGISQSTLTVPTAASGANSFNTYTDLNISNVYTGIYLSGNAAFPDMNNEVGTSSPLLFNSIGGATADDIGAGTGNTASYGIRANNQGDVSIYNNEVRNVSHAGTSTAEGIVVEAATGDINVRTNKVHDIGFTGTTSTANVTGIRVNLSATGTSTAYVFNNFVYAIGSTHSGAPTATRTVKGIYVQSVAGNPSGTINVDFNSVYLDNSGSPNLSGTCFESGSVTGPVINVRNNVFANFTGAQAGAASHFAIASPNATAIGNTGSVSDYNDLYINDPANGFTGIGQATTYATLANWQAAMTQDANSMATDPGFFTANDLHVTAVGLNNAANITGITWVTVDIDNQLRSATPDIGADEFTPALLDAGITALVAPVTTGCYTPSEQVTVTLRNYAAVALDFTVDPVTVTVNVTGAVTQTLNFTISNNALNGNVPLASGSSMNVPAGTLNMSAIGTYTFDAYSTLTGDANAVNDTMNTISIDYMPGTVTVSTDSVCAGSSVTVMLNGSTSGGTVQWQSSTDGGSTWINETGTGFDSTVYNVIPVANTLYQALFCGVLVSNNVSVTWLPFTAAVAMNDTVCGPGSVILSATGSGVINWYADSTGGSSLTTGTSYTTNVTMTDTFYVSNTTGNVTQGVGLFDNSAGGGMSASINNLIFDVSGNCVLSGVFVYPAAAGNVIIDLRDNNNALINTTTVAVTAADINQRTFIPLNFTLTPGTGMQLVRDPASVNLWRNNVGVNYPYTIPGFVSITGSTAGAGFYYYFYDWQIAYGCESPRVPLTVLVNAPPAIVLSAGNTALCLGDSTTLSVTSANTNYTYTWTPGGSLNTTTGASVIATPVTTTMYVVNAMDSLSGCRSADSILVSANAMPVFFVALTNDSVVCSGGPDTLTVDYPGQSVGLFDNSAGGNMSASQNNLIFDVFSNCRLAGVYIYPDAAGPVIIELQDNTNAVLNTATFTATAADVNQRTYVPLNFSLTPATGMQLVRNAGSVDLWRNNAGVNYPYTLPGVLEITGSTAGAAFYYFFYDWQIVTPGPYTFVWTSVPTGFTATGDSAFIAPTVTTQYIVTATDTIAGCVSVFTTTVTIADPVVATISGANSICLGDSTMLYAGSTGGDGNVTYLWSHGLGTGDSVTVIPTVTTTYSLTATDGCGSVSTDSIKVIVSSSLPTAAFTYAVIGLNTFAFNDASSGATSWSWDFGDSQTSTLQNPVNAYAFANTYTVTLIVTNGCGSDTITQVIFADGMNENNFAAGVSVYPNPAEGQFNVSFANAGSSAVTMQLYDLQGKILVEQVIGNRKAGEVVPVNVTGLAPGMYILKLTGESENAVFRIELQ